MENLDPWNMFTTDMVAEETDEILTDEIVADYNRSTLGEDEDTETPKVKQEPEDFRDDDDDDFDEPLAAAANDDDEGDDTIFNFDLEPQVNIAEGDNAVAVAATPPPRSIQNEDNSQGGSNSDANINYESAVVYICPACGAEYDAQNAWKRHMNSMHNYNTRRGLNFIQVDKLYHQCLECHKRIAMHAMENLLKHKFTHLPYRCTKCKICLRQYKYRQDLMVHLRVTHREDLLPTVSQTVPVGGAPSACRLEIKDIKENAIDIFENNFEGIEVKNELIEPDEETDIDAIAEQTSSSFVLPSFLEDALSRSSSSEQYRVGGQEEETFEKCIRYICPECGSDYKTQEQWRQHIEFVHDFGTRKGLNFKEVNMNRHAQCLECDKIIQVNIIPNLQQHKFTHLPHKSWMRCKFCFHAFVGRKEILKHLATQHRVCAENAADESQGPRTGAEEEEDDDSNAAEDQLLTEQSNKSEERDACEPHIDYLCPQCGKDFLDKKMWRKHIVSAHHLTDLSVLNFRVINERQVMCNECDKIITNAYGVQNAQQHRITHMPYKAYIRCRLCAKSYTDRKGLVKHLRSMHSIGDDLPLNSTPSSAAPSPQPLAVYASVLQSMPPLQPKPPHKLHGKPQKEIVKHANVTYEIQYLDDDDEVLMLQGVGSELPFNRSFERPLKCADCGTIFDTQHALKVHIREEHEFPDFKPQRPLSEMPRRPRDSSAASPHQMAREEPSNDADDLLVATGDEEVSSSSIQGGGTTAAIERNFCYLCPACGVEFKTQLDWRRHINEAHNFDKRQYLNFRAVDKFRFQCTECNDIVSSSKLKGLQDHKFRHLPFKLYIMCIICGTCYNHKPNMLSHLRMRHNIIDTRPPERELNCTQQLQFRSVNPRPAAAVAAATAPSAASYSFNKPPGLKTVEDCISFHNAVDHESITYFCPQCNENFDTHVFWRKHIVDEHNLNNRMGLNFRQIDEHHYLCLQCYKRVTVTHTKGAIGQLQSHKFRHLPFKSFKCNACQGEFVRKQMFFKHLSKQTNRCDAMPIEPILVDGEANFDETNLEGGGEVADDHFSAQTGISDALIVNENSFTLMCPQCGEQFESWRVWREHINITHRLGKRDTLNFKKINSHLHQCLECQEQVSGVKLRDLQIHKFKHLPHGAYIQCRFCDAAYYHVSNMKTHLRQKHPNVVQNHDEYAKMEELQQYEDVSPTDTENSNDMAVEEEEPNDEQFLLG